MLTSVKQRPFFRLDCSFFISTAVLVWLVRPALVQLRLLVVATSVLAGEGLARGTP